MHRVPQNSRFQPIRKGQHIEGAAFEIKSVSFSIRHRWWGQTFKLQELSQSVQKESREEFLRKLPQPTESHGNRGCATSTTQKQGDHADTVSSVPNIGNDKFAHLNWRNRRYESEPRGKETLSPNWRNLRKPINIFFLINPWFRGVYARVASLVVG